MERRHCSTGSSQRCLVSVNFFLYRKYRCRLTYEVSRFYTNKKKVKCLMVTSILLREESYNMKRKILGIMLIGLCMSFIACSGSKEEGNSGNMPGKQEVVEQELTAKKDENNENAADEKETVEHELTASEDENNKKNVSGEQENLEQELAAFEDEMYDPAEFVEPGDMIMYEEERWWQEAEPQEIIYRAEDYGEIQEYGSEFYYEEDVMGFYYNLETFYLNSEFLYTMNETLDRFYDDYLYQYRETEDWYMEQGKEEDAEERVPYSELLFLGIQYVGQDYVSLLFNDVTYMGGVHPYSFWDAVTIDCCTGEEVNASEILGINDEEILNVVNELMGLEEYTDWGHLDFYLQGDNIVFFYRMPGYWDDVVLKR